MNGADFPPKIYISSEMRLAEWLCKGPKESGGRPLKVGFKREVRKRGNGIVRCFN